jgi:hypothetical protein
MEFAMMKNRNIPTLLALFAALATGSLARAEVPVEDLERRILFATQEQSLRIRKGFSQAVRTGFLREVIDIVREGSPPGPDPRSGEKDEARQVALAWIDHVINEPARRVTYKMKEHLAWIPEQVRPVVRRPAAGVASNDWIVEYPYHTDGKGPFTLRVRVDGTTGTVSGAETKGSIFFDGSWYSRGRTWGDFRD